ncbi:MAG TPA: hydroxylase [Chloroflexi bacterium]|nr:hydroxylase [Chloroflexota bacterium]
MTEEQIRDALKAVVDPEIGVNIVDLGLIYKVALNPGKVYIQLTMTSPACPLHNLISRDMEKVLHQTFPDLGSLTIELVWEPLWSPEMMSETAKNQLGWTK